MGPQEPLPARVKRRKLWWFGLVTRHDTRSKTNLARHSGRKVQRQSDKELDREWCKGSQTKSWTENGAEVVRQTAGQRTMQRQSELGREQCRGSQTNSWTENGAEAVRQRAGQRTMLRQSKSWIENDAEAVKQLDRKWCRGSQTAGQRMMHRQLDEELDREHRRLDWSRLASTAKGGPEQTEVDELSAASSLVSPL